MTWQRPTPLVGDRSSAKERAAHLDGWSMGDDIRDALQAVQLARRDVRRYRADEVDDELLTEVLAAGHASPSVGHSQPWRFIVIRDPSTRATAAVMADRARLKQAAAMSEEAGRGLLDLKLEGIREAPIGIVVCCDRRAPAEGVLGRATLPDTDLWSCACAIQNMWLTARAAGLGMGWVTLFEPAELAELLGLPEGVETLGWLCLGWPDERPPEPGLQSAGWSKKLTLQDVVLHERWPGSQAPQAPLARLRTESEDAVRERDEADRLLTPLESLGTADRAVDRLRALNLTPKPRLVIAAADHPVAQLGVSAHPGGVTHDVLEATVRGVSLGAVAAREIGASVLVVDASVDGPEVEGAVSLRPAFERGDLESSDALHLDDVERIVEGARALAEQELLLVGEVGIGNTTIAAALAAQLLGLSAPEVVGRGAAADTATIERKTVVVAAALDRATGRTDPLDCLSALGGGEIAALTGVILGTAQRGGLVVLDGLATSVAALLATRIDPSVALHLIAGQRSRERAHALVLRELGLEPLLDLRLRAGEGAGACLAAGLLLHTNHIRSETARTTG